jgi:hypothetical protein
LRRTGANEIGNEPLHGAVEDRVELNCMAGHAVYKEMASFAMCVRVFFGADKDDPPHHFVYHTPQGCNEDKYFLIGRRIRAIN